MLNKILLSIYFSIRYFTILILIFLIVGIYKVESYGIFMMFYYFAINYLSIKYGIIREIDKNQWLDKKNLFSVVSIFILIINIAIYTIFKFSTFEVIILSIIPIIEFYFIKTKKEKQIAIDINTKKVIDDYFGNKK